MIVRNDGSNMMAIIDDTGYGGVPYMTAEDVKARGATVMTLHQGIADLVNAHGAIDPESGGMVNPWLL